MTPRTSTALLDLLLAELAEDVARRVLAALEDKIGASGAGEPWRLVDVDEVAAVLGRSRRWVHGAVKERGLPHIRLDGGALAFDLADVRAWAMARRVPAAELDPLAGRLRPPRDPASCAASRVRRLPAEQKVER